MKRVEQETQRSAQAHKATQKKYGVIALISLLVAGGGYWWWNYGPRPSASEFDPTKVCTTDPRTVMHIHPRLEIVISGEKQSLPVNIGITPACMRAIHTHDTTGTIHVESPVVRDFTLGEFFRVWDKPFDRSHLLDKTADAEHRIEMKIDGQPSEEFENLVLKDGQQIVLSYE